MQGFEGRLVELASDILVALGRGELAADAPVVRAAAAALAELQRPAPAAGGAEATGPGASSPSAAMADGGTGGGGRAARVAPPVEQVLAVARQMRETRRSFASACQSVGDALGASAQAVRNACTRWLGVSAAEWQPLVIEGAGAGVIPLAQRVAARCPWLAERVASEFGVPVARLDPTQDRGAAGRA